MECHLLLAVNIVQSPTIQHSEHMGEALFGGLGEVPPQPPPMMAQEDALTASHRAAHVQRPEDDWLGAWNLLEINDYFGPKRKKAKNPDG